VDGRRGDRRGPIGPIPRRAAGDAAGERPPARS
jgi:hypothetical protein